MNGILGRVGNTALPSEAGKAWKVAAFALKYFISSLELLEPVGVHISWLVVEKVKSYNLKLGVVGVPKGRTSASNVSSNSIVRTIRT